MTASRVVLYCRHFRDMAQMVRSTVVSLEKFLANVDPADKEALTDTAVRSQVNELAEELKDLNELVATFYLKSHGE